MFWTVRTGGQINRIVGIKCLPLRHIVIQLLSLVCSCSTNLVGCPCSNVANSLVWRFSTRRLITFQPFLWITSQFHHGILEPPMKINLCHCQFVLMLLNIHFFPRTITDWNSVPLAVRLSQSIQSFHGGLLSSASSYHCWSLRHSGGNGWSAPIAGYFTEEPSKKERNFDPSVHSTLPHPTQSSPAAETAVITYFFFKFIHQTTPPFIPALVTNLIYYSSSLNNVVVNYS